ncbi:MAG: ACP S-malonyltransferase, partial [Terriglobus roseus]|nr:ACP S-malonyltransferase [Terriglobus roseus]
MPAARRRETCTWAPYVPFAPGELYRHETAADGHLLPRYVAQAAFCVRPSFPKAHCLAGQGVQRVGMIDPWLEAFPNTVKPILEEIDSVLKTPLTKIISEGTNAQLTATENSQPAIMATSIIVLRVFEQDFGFNIEERIDFTLGHSLGEFAALVAGGYLHFDDALRMTRRRGEVMARCSREAVGDSGGEVGMVALVLENESRMTEMIDAIHEFLSLSSSGSKHDSSQDEPAVQQVMIA